ILRPINETNEQEEFMPRGRTLSVQHTLYMTPEMWAYLEQLARQRGRDCQENDIIREAIRAYLDDQADVVGSRRYFQRSFQKRLDQVDTSDHADAARLLFYLHILIHLVAFSVASLITLLSRKEITAQQLVERAVIQARKDESIFSQQVQAVREMTFPD